MASMSALTSETPSTRNWVSEGATDPFRAAQQANAYLRTALDQASEGIMILQPEYEQGMGPKIMLSNTPMAALVGAEPQAGLRGRFLTQLVGSRSEAEDLMKSLRTASKQGGAAWEGDLKTLLGQGTIPCHWKIRAVQDEHGRLLNFTVTVTSKHVAKSRSAAAIQTPNGEADDARRLRNDNLATLSLGVLHDLNNLLGIMMTNLSVASRLAPGHRDMERYIEEALAAAQQARSFTMQTMRMAKDIPTVREAADIASLIRETARVAQSGSGVHLHMHLPKDLWWSVVDSAKITQVLQNLIINGIQAMGNNGYMDVIARNVIVPAGHGLLPSGPHVEILVRDRGCGMAPDILSKVMKGSFTTKVDGNGIGLGTCRRIVEEHTGKLHVSSMKDVGTEVTFWLPATQAQLAPKLPRNNSQGSLQSGVGTVLVVDDEPRLRHVVVAVLKQCGYRVYEASSGEEAIASYRHLMRHENEADLVIMDLTLKGGIDGEDALKEILALNPTAKVVASSGGLVYETKQSYLNLGFCDILPKPYLAPDVSEVVHRQLVGKKSLAA
jgi:signal transduction histidine kinase/ActR/RegA family two-component response regulator